ncbi:hypothetical protein LWI28_004615 [Acer negundo]|uniref:Uncharacterized protein n=1 Tax=Acer negundo TaxID=4023 RepID=A0AAD5JHD3_ACENE|nr:hypothetical protein LWI28_003290 [Acer negundo]KAI9194268.1 hypothetical protein LWI28_004615 [Acer negundo]KAK4856616.1 hypothetical protein QYF36_019301 [Acer negundo]
MKSKERDKGNSNSTSSLDKGDCGQLKNEVIKALDGSGELLRSVEARTRDEEARSQEVGEVILMKSKERDRGRRKKMGEKIDQHMSDGPERTLLKLSKGAKEPSRRPPSQTSATGVITNPLSPTFDPPPPTEQGRNEEAKPKPKNPKNRGASEESCPRKTGRIRNKTTTSGTPSHFLSTTSTLSHKVVGKLIGSPRTINHRSENKRI